MAYPYTTAPIRMTSQPAMPTATTAPWPTAQPSAAPPLQSFAPQPPTSLIRGTITELVDARTVTMGTGESVPTVTALVAVEGVQEPVPMQVWTDKRIQFAQTMVGRRVDVVFGLSANSRQVNTPTGPTTIHNAVLRIKTLIPA